MCKRRRAKCNWPGDCTAADRAAAPRGLCMDPEWIGLAKKAPPTRSLLILRARCCGLPALPSSFPLIFFSDLQRARENPESRSGPARHGVGT